MKTNSTHDLAHLLFSPTCRKLAMPNARRACRYYTGEEFAEQLKRRQSNASYLPPSYPLPITLEKKVQEVEKKNSTSNTSIDKKVSIFPLPVIHAAQSKMQWEQKHHEKLPTPRPDRTWLANKTLPRKHLDNAIAARRHNEAPVLAPHNTAHAFAAHDAVRGDFLRADALVERPEADGCVVAR